MKIYMPEMNRDEVKEALDGAILLVPIATIEQHGPHAPLHTDIDSVTAIVLEVAKQVNPNPRTLVAAPIWFSPSPFEPLVYPGCIKMRKEVYMDALNDLLESYLRGGFKKIVVVNGHGGGTERWIPQVIDKLNSKKSSIWPDWQIPQDAHVVGFAWISFLGEFAREELKEIRKSPPGSDWHAGDVETALQLFLHPDLVDMTKARKGPMWIPSKFAPTDLMESWHYQFIIDGYYGKWKSGEVDAISGDPTLATKELGEKMFNLAVRKISEFVQEFASLG